MFRFLNFYFVISIVFNDLYKLYKLRFNFHEPVTVSVSVILFDLKIVFMLIEFLYDYIVLLSSVFNRLNFHIHNVHKT